MAKKRPVKKKQADHQQLARKVLDAIAPDAEPAKKKAARPKNKQDGAAIDRAEGQAQPQEKNPAAVALGRLGGLKRWEGPRSKTHAGQAEGNREEGRREAMGRIKAARLVLVADIRNAVERLVVTEHHPYDLLRDAVNVVAVMLFAYPGGNEHDPHVHRRQWIYQLAIFAMISPLFVLLLPKEIGFCILVANSVLWCVSLLYMGDMGNHGHGPVGVLLFLSSSFAIPTCVLVAKLRTAFFRKLRKE